MAVTSPAAPYSLARVRTWTASEGTGYSADLMLGKAKVAAVEQDGVGGCTCVHYVSAAARDALAAHMATLPDWTLDLGPGQKPLSGKVDEEHFVDDLFDAYMRNRDFDRLLKRRVALVRPDGRVVTLVKQKPTPEFLAKVPGIPALAYMRCLNNLSLIHI